MESAVIRAFAAFLVLVAAAAIAVGVHDAAIAGESLGVTLFSVVLVVVGAVLAVGAYELVALSRRGSWPEGKRPVCKQRVLVVFFLTIFIGVYVFFAGIGTTGDQRPVVVGVALALVVVALFGLRFFLRGPEAALPRLGASIALGLVGTSIGVSEFWYQNQYAPSHLGRAVSLDVGLHLDSRQDNFDVIRATIGYEDVGGRNVAVIGSTYTLTGSRVVRCHRAAEPKRVQGVFGGFLVDPQRSRFMADVWEIQPAAVLAAGKFVGDGKRLDADVPAGRELVFHVPRGEYQLLRFRAQLFAISASVPLSQRTLPEYVNFPDDNDLYGFWHLQDSSWLHDLVYGRDRWVVIRYELVREPTAKPISPDFRVTARFPDPTWGKGRPGAALVQRLFAEPQPGDSSEPFADTELALEPVAEPTDHDSVPAGCRP
jgi:hypothetical protein